MKQQFYNEDWFKHVDDRGECHGNYVDYSHHANYVDCWSFPGEWYEYSYPYPEYLYPYPGEDCYGHDGFFVCY